MTEATPMGPERVEGYAYIVRGPRGNEFLFPASFGRSEGEAKRHLKWFNNQRGQQRKPFFDPVELVDVTVTIDRRYQLPEVPKAAA